MNITCDGELVLLEVIDQRQLITEPTTCPSCGSPTTRLIRGKTGAVTYCSTPKTCPAVVFAKLDRWIGSSKKGVGILDIGDTMIKALWDLKLLTDPADLYALTVDSLKDVVLESGGKIGASRATKIIANINSKRNLSVATFLGALGIELLGERRVKLLQKEAAGQLDTLDDWLGDKLRTIKLVGFGPAIREAVIAGIDDNRELIKKLLDNGVTAGASKCNDDDSEVVLNVESAAVQPVSKLPLAGKSFCWTGTRDLISEVEALGGIIKSGISKGLTYLVQKDPLSESVKTRKAEEYGTKIIGIDFLRQVVNGTATLED